MRYFSTKIFKRNFGLTTSVLNKEDPIRKLFMDKIKEYKTKSVDGKLVDPSPETEKELNNELDSLNKHYNADKEDLTKFPTFEWKEPRIDPIDMAVPTPKKDVKKPGTEAAPKPDTEAAPKPGTEAAPKPGTEAAPKPGTVAAPKPGTEATQKPGTETAKKSGTDAAQKSGTDTAKKPGTEPDKKK